MAYTILFLVLLACGSLYLWGEQLVHTQVAAPYQSVGSN